VRLVEQIEPDDVTKFYDEFSDDDLVGTGPG
jgi:hypothetical protein